jgi:hypothetical protein
MTKETFENEIWAKARVNRTSELFNMIESTKAGLLERASVKSGKVDAIDVLALATLLGAGSLSEYNIDTLNAISDRLYDVLAAINDHLLFVQRLLASTRKSDLGKFRTYLENYL